MCVLAQRDEPMDALRAHFGPDRLLTGDGALPYAIDGKAPRAVAFPESAEEVAALLRLASEAGLAVAPLGGGTQRGLGGIPSRLDLVIALGRLDRLVAYEPADMTVTVEAGMPLERLQALLAKEGQFLPCDPPLGPGATVGGILATRAAGPLRVGFGTLAERLLGITVVTADGRIAKAGARVVKNVSGYELGRLYTGSLGTLAIIVEATFKVHPLFERREALALSLPSLDQAQGALAALERSGTSPIFLELVGEAGREGVDLLTGFGGNEESVAWEMERAKEALREALPEGHPERRSWEEAHGEALTAHAPKRGEAVTLRAHLLPSELLSFLAAARGWVNERGLQARFAAHAAAGVARLHLQEAEPRALAEGVAWMRERAEERQGHLVVEQAPARVKQRASVWGEPRGEFFLHRAIKERMDPKGILNPGRFLGGL